MPRQRQEGSLPRKDSGGEPEVPQGGYALPFWALAPPVRVDGQPPGWHAPPPLSVESVVSCCDNNRSCLEGFSKPLTLPPCAQLSGRTMGVWGRGGVGGCADKGIQPPHQKKAMRGRHSHVKIYIYHEVLLLAVRFLPSAVSNISTEEQCQYLDLDKPES